MSAVACKFRIDEGRGRAARMVHGSYRAATVGGVASSLRLAFQRGSEGKTAQSDCRTIRAGSCVNVPVRNPDKSQTGLDCPRKQQLQPRTSHPKFGISTLSVQSLLCRSRMENGGDSIPKMDAKVPFDSGPHPQKQAARKSKAPPAPACVTRAPSDLALGTL